MAPQAATKARERLANAPIELEALLDKLIDESANVVDLFRRWDDNLNGMVSLDEFRKALPVLGLGHLAYDEGRFTDAEATPD